MPNIETIVRQINRELVPQFEEKLRAYLSEQDREWLIEQIVRLTLDAHSLEEMDRKYFREEQNRKRQERMERVRALGLDQRKLDQFLKTYKDYHRDRLIKENFLRADVPSKGADWITDKYRSPDGNQLLALAKDMLFGLLFGDEQTNTRFQRTQRELLTLTLPRTKSDMLDFMQAKTEMRAKGTWQDSAGTDMSTDNVVLEIEYGETESEMIKDGIVLALRLINELEINEKNLYGRMEKVEQSTLVS